MTPDDLIAALRRQSVTIPALFEGLSDEEARWRPAPGKWSLLEILNHLCDEERDDFRKRIELTLAGAGEPWPPIDPEGWVTSRDYQSRDLAASLADLRTERAASLRWLDSLTAPDWDRAHEHGSLGPLRAGDLLASWVAHDLLHTRQVMNTRVAFIEATAAPYSMRYAAP